MPDPMAVTFRQRIEFRIARMLGRLSPRTQIRLARQAPIRIDGQTLEPDIQLTLAMLERQGAPPIESLDPPRAREVTQAQARASGGRAELVASVRDLTVDGAAGPLRARLYAPPEPGDGPHPLIVFYHGGGFVVGDLETHDQPCRLLCRHAGANVLAIDYRLAPEHRFPAAAEDARAALRWAFDHADELGADRARVAVAGDSAGGNLAAVAAWMARHDDGPAPVFQLLFYPTVDGVSHWRSRDVFAEGFFLTRGQMEWFEGNYIDAGDATDPRAQILRADDLSGLAPALVVTAGFDPLRDEGEAYAAALRDAGNTVTLRRFPGQIHGFINFTGVSPTARDALVECAGAARAMLAAVPAAVPAS